jgi:hypothetical protein
MFKGDPSGIIWDPSLKLKGKNNLAMRVLQSFVSLVLEQSIPLIKGQRPEEYLLGSR